MKAKDKTKEQVKFMVVDPNSSLPVAAYVILVVAFLILSGILASGPSWLRAFDFNSLTGEFGIIKASAHSTFIGAGGTGAKQGFIFGITLIPGVMLSLGIMSIVEQTGGLEIARRWLTPVMRPLFGLPGCASLAMIASMQSTDAGASLTKVFYEQGEMTDKERIIFTQYELSGAAAVSNYITIGSAAFAIILVPMVVPLAVILLMKVVGANITRAILNQLYPKLTGEVSSQPKQF